MNEPVNEPVLICWELLTTPSVFNFVFTPSKKCAEPVFKLMVPVVVITPPLNPSLTVMDVTPEPAEDGAHDAETAKLAEVALLAQLAVPNNEPVSVPVNEPVKEPVLIWIELDTVPTGKRVVTCPELDTIPDGILESPV